LARKRDLAEGLFHVTCHSVWGLSLFRDDIDRLEYIAELDRTRDALGWICVAVVLMTTHVHLILDVRDGALAEGMHRLSFRHAVRFNARHRRRGHVFGARYDERRLVDDSYLQAAYRYVVLNPVEAGLADRPEDWRWSSYAAAIGARDDFSFVDPSRVLGSFGGPPEIAIHRLKAFAGDR
jgi:REP element-mobilizing transposase RayT